ncbi:MAG: XRE family transcriptional regulator [Steroidobacteraceae bacterium]
MALVKPSQRREEVVQPAAGIKADLAERIVCSIDRQGLTVREAESQTGNAAADFSRLRQGQLERFSIERLLDMANRLGERLVLTVQVVPGDCKQTVPAPLVGHLKALRALCRRFAVRRLSAFGSVLRPDFDPAKSDMDFTVEFGRSRRYGPADQYFEFKAGLERLVERQVDLVEMKALADSRLKRTIERTQVPVYDQAA